MSEKLVINCVGDSVTEGMEMRGHHASGYGEASYPAQLYTILKDNGYENVEVNNYGHGGECYNEIVSRIGGVATVISESLTVPDNAKISLGVRKRDKGKTTGTKLRLCYEDESGEELCVYYTQMSHDTNPVTINGTQYIMSVENDNENVIHKMYTDHKETIIPAGSVLFTANKRNPDVNIIFGGVNDGESFTLKRFTELTQKCAQVNGGKYIVLGSTNAVFNDWGDVKGDTAEEKYKYYRKICLESFGIHFIDLYDEFSKRGLDIAISAGYFKNITDEEKSVMREKLLRHIMPSEFVYDKKSENNVHLSEEGYHVIAVLVFERLKLLGYLNQEGSV